MARYCLKCRYPLEHLRQNLCPECGLPFDLADPDSYARTTGKIFKFNISATVVWAMTCLVSFFYLFTLQWAFIGWWHGIRYRLWWFIDNVRGGSWWVFEGPGRWLFAIQLGVFVVASAVIATIVARRCHRSHIIVVTVLMLLGLIILLMSTAWLTLVAAVVFLYFATCVSPLVFRR